MARPGKYRHLLVPFLEIIVLFLIFPSVSCILCHDCYDDPATGETCESTVRIRNCSKDPDFGDELDSCYTFTYNVSFGDNSYVIREKNCTVADEETCSHFESHNCRKYRNHISQYDNGRLNSCEVRCCSGSDYCNEQPTRTGENRVSALSNSVRQTYRGPILFTLAAISMLYGM